MKIKSTANQRGKTLHSLDPGLPKHRQIFEQLLGEIQSGVFKPQDRLPSEAELGKRFDASRITIAKAVKELQSLGLVSRRAGAGTYVLPKVAISGLVFGLLIPDLGRTEIFEPICQGMMRSPLARAHSLLWGPAINLDTHLERETEQLCLHYISQGVSGIFFAPVEFADNKDAVNALVAKIFDRAGIPIVLLDRCYMPYPERSNYDLVGIDNRRTGYQITAHLLNLGARRIVFMAAPRSAATVDARIAGYRGALFAAGIRAEHEMVCLGNPEDPSFVKEMMRTCQPEAIVCANDLTAARLMPTLSDLGVKVPEQVRMVGIDDVRYASLLPVPLTTHHQNCADIGNVAMMTMLERIAKPTLPTRDILLQTNLVVRKSCGSYLGPIKH
jgi:GntR family transcriptional regulator, arabinose operon transcriptional repressor